MRLCLCVYNCAHVSCRVHGCVLPVLTLHHSGNNCLISLNPFKSKTQSEMAHIYLELPECWALVWALNGWNLTLARRQLRHSDAVCLRWYQDSSPGGLPLPPAFRQHSCAVQWGGMSLRCVHHVSPSCQASFVFLLLLLSEDDLGCQVCWQGRGEQS